MQAICRIIYIDLYHIKFASNLKFSSTVSCSLKPGVGSQHCTSSASLYLAYGKLWCAVVQKIRKACWEWLLWLSLQQHRTLSPVSPAAPGGPLSPLIPFSPGIPGGPGGPSGPIGPCGPSGPGWPWKAKWERMRPRLSSDTASVTWAQIQVCSCTWARTNSRNANGWLNARWETATFLFST